MAKASLLIDDAIRQDLEREAERAGESSSRIAEKAIGSLLRARAAKRRAIEEAIVEADKGVFISSEAVQRWVESWDTENELPMPEPDIFPK